MIWGSPRTPDGLLKFRRFCHSRLTPLRTVVRRPWRVRRSVVRSYDKGGRASRHLRWRAQCSMLRHAHVTSEWRLGSRPPGLAPHHGRRKRSAPSSLGLARTSLLRQCFCVAFQSLSTPRSRRSTGNSGRWWKPPPFNRRRALCSDTDSWPLSPPGEWERTSRIAPSTHHYSRRRAEQEAAAAPRPDPAPAPHRPPVHECLVPN